MDQLTRTLQTMLDCQQDTTLENNSHAAQQDSANSNTTTDHKNDDQFPIVCITDAVGIINFPKL